MKLWLKGKNGDWKLFENVTPSDLESRNIKISDRATVGDWATVGDGATVGDRATVEKTIDCVVIGPIGSRESMLTGYSRAKEIWIGTGCFIGSIEKFRSAVKEKCAGTKFELDYLAALTYIESRLNMAREP